ncbi:hypothetical protein ABD77_22475 [Brevibacillus formosus]|nr:hypothetical protein [Brevibacillus formosus]
MRCFFLLQNKHYVDEEKAKKEIIFMQIFMQYVAREIKKNIDISRLYKNASRDKKETILITP